MIGLVEVSHHVHEKPQLLCLHETESSQCLHDWGGASFHLSMRSFAKGPIPSPIGERRRWKQHPSSACQQHAIATYIHIAESF